MRTERYIRIVECQLGAHPLCAYCAELGIVARATTCDHRDGQLISLCEECDEVTSRWSFRIDIGLDGWPLDKNHPVYKQRAVVTSSNGKK
jgi:hypothetical protein